MVTYNSTADWGATPFVVSLIPGQGKYITIQSAITAAAALGGSNVIYVCTGTYTENLTFPSGINVVIQGVGTTLREPANATIIVGSHTPPTTGSLSIQNIWLQSGSGTVFSSAAAGTAGLSFRFVAFNLTAPGDILSITNWTGAISFATCNDLSASSSYVINTAGAPVSVLTSALGNGRMSTISALGNFSISRINGPTTFTATSGFIADVTFLADITFAGSASVYILNCNIFNASVNINDTSTPIFVQGMIFNIPDPAIVFNTSSGAEFLSVSIQTGATSAVDGTGTGQLGFSNINWGGDAAVNPAITDVESRGIQEIDRLYLDNLSFNRGATSITADGQLIIGSGSGNPSIATLTSGTGITITNGPGSITIDSTGGGFTWSSVSGVSQVISPEIGYMPMNSSLTTFTLPPTAAFGDTFRIMGYGSGGWTIAQNSGQVIHYGNTDTTLSLGGSLSSTNQYDCVEIVCSVADTEFNVVDSQGSLGVI